MSNFRVALKWFAEDYYNRVTKEETSRMHKAVRHIANKVKVKLSKRIGKGAPGRNSKGKFTKGRAIRSKWGEPPRLETGNLRRSIATEVKDEGKIVGRVGTNVKYGKWLELPSVLNRPFLMSTLKEERNNIAKILLGQKIQ